MPETPARALASAIAACACLAVLAAPLEAQVYTRINGNGVVEATNVPDSPGYRLTYEGKGTLIHSRGFHRRYSGEFDQDIEAAARLHQVSPELVKAVIAVESEFDQWAVSSKGARGLMQLMPATARRLGVTDSFDARANIFAGTQYLAAMLDQFAGDVALALAAYNAGPNAVARYRGIPPYRETRGYVAKVQSLLGGVYTLPSKPAAPGSAASFFTPSNALPRAGAALRTRAASRPRRLEPARPPTYYRWRDERGTTHVAETPPPEGMVFQVVRALD